MQRIASAATVAMIMMVAAACGGDSNPGTGPVQNPGPAPVATVTLAPATSDISLGSNKQLTASVKDGAGNVLSGRAISWSSSANAVATVDASGKVTGVGAGSATISASSDGKIGTAEVNVINVPVHTINIDPPTASVFVGRSRTLNAIALDAQGNELQGRTIAWTSLHTDIATVDAGGNVTAIAPGFADIMAASEGVTRIAQITVTPVLVSSVRIDSIGGGIALGNAITLHARAFDDQNAELQGKSVKWTSSNPAAITVDENTGVARAVAPGTASITASVDNKNAVVVLKVLVPVATVQVTAALDTIEAWDTAQLTSVERDALGNVLNGRVVRWTSSDTTVAKVDSITGVLLGLDRGTVTITATSEGISGSAKRVVVIKYREITAGTTHACDIASGGLVWCWGLSGREGRLGDGSAGDNVFSNAPVLVSKNLRFTRLSTFARHTCGITVDGLAYCWGTNSWGSLGTGTNIAESYTPVAVAGGHRFKQISVGADHSCGTTTAGRAYCWGNGNWRQLGNNSSTYADAPAQVAIDQNVSMVVAGVSFSCALTTTGSAYCWGANTLGQIGDGGKISYGNVYVALPNAVVGGLSFKSISLGQSYACGVTTLDQAYCWGSDGGRLGSGNKGDTSAPRAVSGGHIFRDLSAGAVHACGVDAQAAILCWGANGNGQLGIQNINGSTSPTRIDGDYQGAEVAAAGIGTGSAAYTCAISRDRLSVKCWGRNDFGQLGNGATTPAASRNPTPAQVVGQKPLPVS